MGNNFGEFIICFIESLLLYMLYSQSAKPKFKFKFYVPILLAITLVSYILTVNGGNFYIKVVSGLLIFYIFSLSFKASNFKRVFLLVIFYISMFLSDIIVMGTFTLINREVNWGEFLTINTGMRLYVGIVSKFLNLILIKFYDHFISRSQEKMPRKYWMIFMLLTVLMFLCIAFFISDVVINEDITSRIKNLLLYIAFILLLINIVLLFLFEKVCYYFEAEDKYKEMIHSKTLTEKYYKSKEENFSELKKVMHDFKNHIYTTMQLMKNKDYIKAENYLEEIYPLTEIKDVVITGNKIADIVILQKINWGKDYNIEFLIDGAIEENINLNDNDLCSLLANILDNAVEASIGVEKPDKKIKLKFQHNGDYLYIRCANLFEESPKVVNEIFISIKSDKENHGFGMEIIKDVVKKYNGELKYDTKNGEFILSILLKVYS